MNKVKFLICCLFVSSVALGQKYDSFGEKFKAKDAVSVNTLSNDVEEVKIEGEVESVCQAKGCWMKLKLANGETMRVTFKDYGFFVPKDIEGKTVVILGDAKVRETSVDELQHYAKDAGKSEAEIAKIKTPKKEMAFVATGVLIEKK